MNRRTALASAAMAAIALPLAGTVSRAMAASPKRKLIWVPQALGDWDTPFQVGAKEFCDLVGWEYQRIGNPNYSAENHLEQVNNAIAAKPDVILTELESPALISAFKTAKDHGITMVITDQCMEDEAAKLGLAAVNESGYDAGMASGKTAATLAQKKGKKEGWIVLGNGNPGSVLIDDRQRGAGAGVAEFNKANGTNFSFEGYPDGEFGEMTTSIQKWTAKIREKGDGLVAILGTGNPMPLIQAMQELGKRPGEVLCGSHDVSPAYLKAMRDGWLQWLVDQEYYPQGYYSAASGYMVVEGKYTYPSIKPGSRLITAENIDAVSERVDTWVKKAKTYGFMR
jgi:simple sugar transport system substrate-binding protein